MFHFVTGGISFVYLLLKKSHSYFLKNTAADCSYEQTPRKESPVIYFLRVLEIYGSFPSLSYIPTCEILLSRSSLEPLISLDLVCMKLYCFRARVHCYYCLYINFSTNPVRRSEKLRGDPKSLPYHIDPFHKWLPIKNSFVLI